MKPETLGSKMGKEIENLSKKGGGVQNHVAKTWKQPS